MNFILYAQMEIGVIVENHGIKLFPGKVIDKPRVPMYYNYSDY